MTNTSFLTQTHASTGDPLAWQYGQKDNKVATAGPDNCASGDMCWGTTFDDDDYTDDVIGGATTNPYSWFMDSPAIYVDSSLNDTYLRFSSWHSFKTDLTPNGDYTYSDCAYLQIRTSPNGVLIQTYSMTSHTCLSMFHCPRGSHQEMAILQDMIPLLRPTKFPMTVMACHLTPTDWPELQ